MNKIFLYSVSFILIFIFLSGCQKDSRQTSTEDSYISTDQTLLTEEAPDQTIPSSENGVTLRAEKAEYTTAAEEIIVIVQNDSQENFDTGLDVFLEKKVEGTWYRIPMKDEFFTEQAIIHFPGDSTRMGLNVSDLDYDLSPGKYRATLSGLAAPFEVTE